MARRTRIILGLNSGTSADGVDAVACEIIGRGQSMRVRVLGHTHRAYPAELRDRILAVMAPAETRTEELCRLDHEIGVAFAMAAETIVKRLGLKAVDCVGSHGQTVCHLPPGGGLHDKKKTKKAASRRPRNAPTGSTMQLGDAAIIAARLGVPVVSQFRQADMAVGGQGAPLVPWTDFVLSHHSNRNRIIQNIGGIANLTWLPAGGTANDVIAFDTGPGNMAIDALVRHFTHGREQYDHNGVRAARGTPNPAVLEDMLDHPFMERPLPKSCGREEFGEVWVQAMLRRHAKRRLSTDDWIATATRFTAMSLVLGYMVFVPSERGSRPPMDEIILCGGGAKNPTLVGELAECISFHGLFEDVAISTTADYGVPTLAKEGLSFAMLAAARMDRVPANLPQVTGAREPVILGQVCEPVLPKGGKAR